MLFGYLKKPDTTYKDDVYTDETSIESMAFDRALILPSELYVAGAMAFAVSFGFGGMSLIGWALVKTIESVKPTSDTEDHSNK